MLAVTVFWRLRRRLARGVLISLLKSKARTLGDLLCEVKSDAETWPTHRSNIKVETARRALGNGEGIRVLRGLKEGRQMLLGYEREVLSIGKANSKGDSQKSGFSLNELKKESGIYSQSRV